MVDLTVENVVVEIDFSSNLDLHKIAESINNAEYNPDQFPGLMYKLKSPKTLTLMFSKGYSVCTGAKSLQNARAALIIIYKKLRDLKLIEHNELPEINVQNIIVSYKYKNKLNLEMIAKKLPTSDSEMEYDPKKFSGLVYKDKITEITVLLFKSGVIVGYGNPILLELDQLLTELEQFYT